MNIPHQVKMVGTNGQISLGKEFAGKMVMVNQINEGIWIIKVGEFIPDSERWLHRGSNLSKLEKALKWAENNKPTDNFEKIAQKIDNDKD
jgi:hypothetical protein